MKEQLKHDVNVVKAYQQMFEHRMTQWLNHNNQYMTEEFLNGLDKIVKISSKDFVNLYK